MVERKAEYGKIVHEHGQWQKKVKSREEQIYEQTSRVLSCTPLTNGVSLDYIEHAQDGSETVWRGGATRMRNGWFRVILENDKDFKVREEDLLNNKIYKIKIPKKVMTSEERDKINRKIKRLSKRQEEELTHRRKQEAKAEREKMLDNEMEKILEYSRHGFMNKKCLQNLIKKATEPFTYTCGGYQTVVDESNSSCVSILSLKAVNTVLSDKRKADEISKMEALHRQNSSNKKARRTPNTTRSDDGIIVRENLWQHDNHAAEENKQKDIKRLEKHLEATQTILTEWKSIVEKRQKTADIRKVPIDHPSLWLFCTQKAFTAGERKVILRLCAPESKMLLKGEREHIDVFQKHNVTYLKIMAAIEDKNIELTSLKKQLEELRLEEHESVETIESDDEIDLNDAENDC